MYPAGRADRRESVDRFGAAKSRPLFVIPTAFVLFLVFGLGPNSQFALLACTVLVAGTFLLWRPGEAQILLFLFAFQWLQPTITVFYANLRDMTLVAFMPDFPGIDFAITLVLLGLLFLALGIRIGAGKQQAIQIVRFRETIQRILPSRWLRLHLVALVVSSAALPLAEVVPGLSQPLLALANFKWATFLLFTISTFSRREGWRIFWLAIFCIEFVMSLGGYFSSFKSVFLYTLIATTAVSLRLTPKLLVGGTIAAIIMVTLALYWTAIKPDYRGFVSGGNNDQDVTVSKGEAILKIVELIGQVTSDQILEAADHLARRFSDIEMFSAVVTNVPGVIPHEWGKLWRDAITRPFMPRILFSDKAIIDESALTRHYTGMAVAGMEQGTQIGMGYIAESYIDFGESVMMLPILLFGVFIGRSHRWLLNHPSGFGVLGVGLSSATFLQISVGASSAKLCGGIIVSLLAAYIALKLVAHYNLQSAFIDGHRGR